MKLFSFFWLRLASLFEPVQYFFNGNFWVRFIEQFGNFKDKKVLDLACGTGEINKYIKPKSYLGLDINNYYINLAKKNFTKKNIQFEVSDVTDFKLFKRVDIALLISAAHHMPDEEFHKVAKCLKRNQVKEFIIVDAIPVGVFAGVLKWFDAVLGGGEYFRSLEGLEKIIGKKYKIKKKGFFDAEKSFYRYYFLDIML